MTKNSAVAEISNLRMIPPPYNDVDAKIAFNPFVILPLSPAFLSGISVENLIDYSIICQDIFFFKPWQIGLTY